VISNLDKELSVRVCCEVSLESVDLVVYIEISETDERWFYLSVRPIRLVHSQCNCWVFGRKYFL